MNSGAANAPGDGAWDDSTGDWLPLASMQQYVATRGWIADVDVAQGVMTIDDLMACGWVHYPARRVWLAPYYREPAAVSQTPEPAAVSQTPEPAALAQASQPVEDEPERCWRAVVDIVGGGG
jgi:hypothetical protein